MVGNENRLDERSICAVEEVVPRTGGRRKECELAISRIGVGGAIFACGWVASIGYFNIFISPSDLVEKDSDQFV